MPATLPPLSPPTKPSFTNDREWKWRVRSWHINGGSAIQEVRDNDGTVLARVEPSSKSDYCDYLWSVRLPDGSYGASGTAPDACLACSLASQTLARLLGNVDF